MSKRAITQSRRFSFPTPLLQDVLVIEERDLTIEKDIELGEPHPDGARYPNHKLIFVDPIAKGEGHKSNWYYAADRADQESYNYEISYPYSGLINCPRIQRTYVLPRKGYRALAKGSPDPYDKPGSDYALFAGAELVFEETKRIGAEFDSLYVVVVRIFERVPTVGEQMAESPEFAYPVQGITGQPQIVRKLVVNKKTYTPTAKGTPDTTYTSALLVKQSTQRFGDALADSRYVLDIRTYEVLAGTEILAKRIALNAEVPDRFVVKTTLETGTTTRLAPDTSLTAPAGGDPRSALIEVQRTLTPENDPERATARIEVERLHVDVSPLYAYELDPYTGAILPITQELVPAGTQGTGIDSNGYYSEVTPLSTRWSVKTTRKVTSLGPDLEHGGRTWTTHESYVWPRVIVDFFLVSDGESGYWLMKEAFTEPCKVVYAVTYHTTPPLVADPMVMHPLSFQVKCGNVTFEVPESLHYGFPMWEDKPGNKGIRLASGNLALGLPKIPRTNYVDWPPTMQTVDVTPFQGGYRRTIKTFYRPDVTTFRGEDVTNEYWPAWR